MGNCLKSEGTSLDGTPDGEEVCIDGKKEDSLRNGSDSKRRHRNKKGGDGQQNSNNTGGGELILSESNATEVVRQINEELAEFREQLKKSQELFTVLRFNSSQSISLTKSCPVLALVDPNNDSNNKLYFINNTSINGSNSKAVSCGTQTDSPVIETPVLAQKLCLVSSSSSPLGQHSLLHHHEIAQHHFLSSPGESIDNASFDKLSDDGSVRVRDDLSMVLEVSEQENDASPGATRRTMSFEKGGINRPKLKRMANALEDEEGHPNHNSHNNHQRNGSSSSKGGANSSSGSDKNNHLGVLDDPMMVTSDNDYVSATSSQAESVYLSLERPLKVTLGSSTSGSGRGEGDRASSNYRSCASSIRSGRGASAQGLVSPGDCDTASLVSEGNTTFGSPLSSPSSPYWTPSQGSSSQETITPLDGERTPVNEHEQFILTSEHCSPLTPYQRFSLMGSPSQSEPSSLKRNRGMIPDNKMQDMLRMAHCPVNRNTNPEASFLDNGEWRQLRQDTDRNDKETYRKTFAQALEEGNDDEGAGGGSSACGQPTYAFAADEEAEQYLETIPDLATKLFEALDVIRKKKRSGDDGPTPLDREDLDRKFNHMAEVFQTEHINLDQRIGGLTKEFRESEANLKEISKSLKSSLSSLKNISAELSNDSLLDVMRLLANTSDEFEIYATGLSRSARRLGMMDVHSRLHKMIDVMVLYVHILRTECDNLQNLKSNYTSVQTDFEHAKKLLSENEIPFTSTSASGTLQNNNNNDEKEL